MSARRLRSNICELKEEPNRYPIKYNIWEAQELRRDFCCCHYNENRVLPGKRDLYFVISTELP